MFPSDTAAQALLVRQVQEHDAAVRAALDFNPAADPWDGANEAAPIAAGWDPRRWVDPILQQAIDHPEHGIMCFSDVTGVAATAPPCKQGWRFRSRRFWRKSPPLQY